jgi:hypothetical protein
VFEEIDALLLVVDTFSIFVLTHLNTHVRLTHDCGGDAKLRGNNGKRYTFKLVVLLVSTRKSECESCYYPSTSPIVFFPPYGSITGIPLLFSLSTNFKVLQESTCKSVCEDLLLYGHNINLFRPTFA